MWDVEVRWSSNGFSLTGPSAPAITSSVTRTSSRQPNNGCIYHNIAKLGQRASCVTTMSQQQMSARKQRGTLSTSRHAQSILANPQTRASDAVLELQEQPPTDRTEDRRRRARSRRAQVRSSCNPFHNRFPATHRSFCHESLLRENTIFFPTPLPRRLATIYSRSKTKDTALGSY